MVGPLGLYGIAQGIDELDAPVLFVGHVLGRDGTVKNHVCMCRAGHNAQVVDVGQRRELLDLTLQKRLQLVRVGITGHDGVKVDRRDQPSSTSRSRSIRSMTSWLRMTSSLASISRWKLTRRLPGP